MKTHACLTAAFLLLLSAAPAPAAPPPTELQDMGTELSALTEAIGSQIKLLAIYEEMGKTAEAVRTRTQIVDMVERQRALLDRIGRAVGGKAAAPTIRSVPRAAAPRIRITRRPSTPDAAAKAGRAWLASAQHPDGYWDSDGFGVQIGAEDPRAAGAGYALYDAGVTGLALLAFLEAGETHKSGDYRSTVEMGLKYLRRIQDPEGCFGPRTTNHFTYNHAIDAIAMCEAYALTKSPLFKASAQSAIDFVLKCQNPYLAWRYGVRPGDNDTSATGWMVAALESGNRAGLRVDQAAFDGAHAWLDKVTEPEYGRVGYTVRGTGPARPQAMMDRFPSDKSESLTAEGILVRLVTGEDPKKSEMIVKGLDLCLKVPPTWDEKRGSIDMYYWFWGTMAMQRIGGEPWEAWSKPMRAALLGAQRTDGVFAGSWDPVGVWGQEGGRIYSTALMTMIATMLEQGAR